MEARVEFLPVWTLYKENSYLPNYVSISNQSKLQVSLSNPTSINILNDLSKPAKWFPSPHLHLPSPWLFWPPQPAQPQPSVKEIRCHNHHKPGPSSTWVSSRLCSLGPKTNAGGGWTKAIPLQANLCQTLRREPTVLATSQTFTTSKSITLLRAITAKVFPPKLKFWTQFTDSGYSQGLQWWQLRHRRLHDHVSDCGRLQVSFRVSRQLPLVGSFLPVSRVSMVAKSGIRSNT